MYLLSIVSGEYVTFDFLPIDVSVICTFVEWHHSRDAIGDLS